MILQVYHFTDRQLDCGGAADGLFRRCRFLSNNDAVLAEHADRGLSQRYVQSSMYFTGCPPVVSVASPDQRAGATAITTSIGSRKMLSARAGLRADYTC